jgi:hypothetical protein
MKKSPILFSFLFLLIIICLTGCQKDSYKESIIGKWKLDNVMIFENKDEGYLNNIRTISYLENNIIYDFQNHNTLFVTSSVSGVPQTKKYTYKCERRPDAFCETMSSQIQVKIGKEIFYGSVSRDYPGMVLLRGVNSKKIMDETDLMTLESDSLRVWQKNFIKLN